MSPQKQVSREPTNEVISTPDGGYIAPIKPPLVSTIASVAVGVAAVVAGYATNDAQTGWMLGTAAVVGINALTWPGRIMNRPTDRHGAEAWEEYNRTGQTSQRPKR